TGRFEAVWISIACSVIGIRNVPVHVLLSPRATSQVCPVSSVCRETPVCRRRVQPRKAGRFIYNGDLYFALLSDWTDAPLETMPGDDDLLAATIAGIERLNRRYGPALDGSARFLLYHRRRGWNPREPGWRGGDANR